MNEEEVVQLLEMNRAEGLSIEAKTGVDACGTERQCEPGWADAWDWRTHDAWSESSTLIVSLRGDDVVMWNTWNFFCYGAASERVVTGTNFCALSL